MLNMDMVGRLNSEKKMAINGTGTSPTWNEVLQGLATEVSIITSESGVGPSDHTSFYNKHTVRRQEHTFVAALTLSY